MRVTALTVPALAADAVLGELRGFDACPSHKTKSLTSADVALSQSTPTASSHRHHRSRP